jgi:two-component system, NtrC family, response regulator HydG
LALSTQIELFAIDDDPLMLDFIEGVLAQPGLHISRWNNPQQGWESLRQIHPDIVVLDQNIPELNGMELLGRIVEWDPTIEVVMLSGEYSTELAVKAIQKGACDYLTKPIMPVALRERLDLLIEAAKKRHHTGRLEGESLDASKFSDMIGRSVPMLDVFALVRRIAPHFRSVLVSGPTRTGNELVARALHQMSPVRAKPFVVCNCAAIVETLFESELFGHVRGSLPARPRIGRGTLNRLTAAHFFWTKSVKSRSKCRPNFSAHCKAANFRGWVLRPCAGSASGQSRQPTGTCARWFGRMNFAKICSFGFPCWRSSCLP